MSFQRGRGSVIKRTVLGDNYGMRLRLTRVLALFACSGAILSGQPDNPVEITGLRQAVMQGTTRVVIEFSGEFEFHGNRLHEPERVYFDFPNAKTSKAIRSSYLKEAAEESISRVRIAQPIPGTTRVVLDLAEEAAVSTSKLQNPYRLLIELRPGPPAAPQGPTAIPSAPSVQPTPALKPPAPALASRPDLTPLQAQPKPDRRHVLRLSTASAAPGGVAEMRLDLDSPAGQEPQALQWEVAYPSPKLGLEDGDLTAGSVASEAGKSLICAGRVESAAEYVYRCIVAGGLKVIPNGTVALIHFRVRPHADGIATVRTINALAVVSDAKEVLIQPNEGVVTIR